MIQRNEIYKCTHCGNIVEVVHGSGPVVVCCGEPMTKLVENTVDASKEKHVPVIERQNGGILVKVGSVAHPMEEKHYIEMIQLIVDNKICTQYLKPGDKPEAFFPVSATKVAVREYCNLHGLWKSEG